MSKKRTHVRLSAGELEIMALLWNEGELTLAEAHQSFGKNVRSIAYPTMQTRLNRLVAKGLVKRSDERPAVYRAAISRDQVGAGHVGQLLDRVGRGIVVPLVAHLLSEGQLSPQEIAELKRLLIDAENASSSRTHRRD